MLAIHSKTALILTSFAVVSLLVSGPLWRAFGPLILINYTDSLPHGFYLVRSRVPRQQEIAAFYLPTPVAWQYRDRAWLIPDAIFLKPVAFYSGTRLCWRAHRMLANSRKIAILKNFDARGLPLRYPRGCLTLKSKEIFALSTFSRNSFDSRYFGPIQRTSVIGTATPLLTW